MSADASIVLAWGDGEHRFRLPIGQLRELQDKCSAGPAEILGRIRMGSWRIDDLRETLRLGLIGGGMKPVDALLLVQRYVDARPYAESAQPAYEVLAAALFGPEEAPGKGEAPASEETDGSPSAPSTEVAPSSDSPPPM